MEKILALLSSRGIGISVLSNKPDCLMEPILSSVFPSTSFACILGDRPGSPRKPNPDGARQAMKTMGLIPEETAFIGDSEIDVETGREAGMFTIAVSWGYRNRLELEAAKPDAIVDGAEDILAYFL
jgi:phosphoglycolate phosphatase